MRIGEWIRSGRDGDAHAGRHGQMLAAAGGAALLGSLWLPWYSDPVPQTAWQTFTAMPAVLLVIGTFVAILSILELCARTGDTSRLSGLAGAVAVILLGYRLGMPPLAGMHLAWGGCVALVSALTVFAGGMLGPADRSLPEIPVPALSLGHAHAPTLESRPAP
jgi:hypothetical protein